MTENGFHPPLATEQAVVASTLLTPVELDTRWELFKAYILSHQSKLVHFLQYRFQLSPEDAEDIVQETLIQVVRRLANAEFSLLNTSGEPAKSPHEVQNALNIYVRGVLRYAVYRYYRNNRIASTLLTEEVAMSHATVDIDDALLRMVAEEETIQALASLKKTVANREAIACLKLYIEGYNQVEIAALMNLSPEVVRVRFHRLRQQVRASSTTLAE